MYSYGPPHMDNQPEHTYSSYVRIRDVAWKTYRRWWTIGRSGERGSGIFVLAARHDDDDDDDDDDELTLAVFVWFFCFLFSSLISLYFDVCRCKLTPKWAQSAWAVEYADCISAKMGKTPPLNKCPGYDTKWSEGEASVLKFWGM